MGHPVTGRVPADDPLPGHSRSSPGDDDEVIFGTTADEQPILSFGETCVKVHVVPAIDVVSSSVHRSFRMEPGFVGGPAGGVVVCGVDQFESVQSEHVE